MEMVEGMARTSIWLMICCLSMQLAYADGLSTAMTAYLSALDESIAAGIYIADTKGRVLYEKHADRQMTPASVLKWATAVLAYDYLGPSFRFVTQLQLHGKQRHDRVIGQMALIFSGDPTLTRDDLKNLYKQIYDHGITRIRCEMWYDDLIFNKTQAGPGWMWDELADGYAAPVRGGNVDRNQYMMMIKPSWLLGGKAKLQCHSAVYCPSTIDNHIRTVLSSDCQINSQIKDNRYELSGCIPWHGKPVLEPLSVIDVRKHMMVLNRWAQRKAALNITTTKVHWRKHVKDGRFNALPLYKFEHQSVTLMPMLHNMLMFSDNLIAESLFKTMGHRWFGGQGSWQQSGAFAQAALTKNLPKGHFKVVDGSGLSRYNHISARQLGWLLQFATRHENEALIHVLPKPGQGTLKHRLLTYRDQLHVKTGSMTDVSSMLGILHRQNKPDVIFVIMLNGLDQHQTIGHRVLIDDFVKAMVKQLT